MPQLLAPDLLAGAAVFVSGGGSGVNLGIATCLGELGAAISICGRSEERLQQAAEGLKAKGIRVLTSVADVRDPEAVCMAFARTRETFGPVSGVVCGAAGNFLSPAEKISSNGFRAVVDIDLVGSFHCAHAAFDQLRETGGSLLFVSGGQSVTAYASQAHVGAAKAGVDQLMRTLAVEWGRFGIRCNSILPGPVEGTEGMRRLSEIVAQDTWVSSVPLGRYADPAEIGRMAAVLLSPLGAYVTGSVIAVDGGFTTIRPLVK